MNDFVREAISSSTDLRLDDLMEITELAISMAASHRKYVRSLTKDTSTALEQTCKGLEELVRYLLAKSHSYISLGKFITDLLERAFDKLRQGNGGAYFTDIQQVLEKFNISKAKLMLRCDIGLFTFTAQDGNFCEKCSYSLLEEQCKVFDSLPHLKETLPYDVKSTLVHITGYVTRKDESNANDTFDYVETFGRFTHGLDSGGLNIPSNSVCEWECFCKYYLLFSCKRYMSQLSL